MSSFLSIRQLSKSFKSGGRDLVVLDQASFELERGESLAVLGPSGSGKSTLLALIAGLDQPSAGGVWVDDHPIHEMNEDALARFRRKHVGFVFQSFQLLANRTAIENIRLPLELLGRGGAKERAASLLDEVGLSERGSHYPSQLSGGEQQRVALARAFANEPALLLADEPTGNLDSANGGRVMELLAELQKRFQTTLVVVTHDPAVKGIVNRVANLSDGILTFETDPDAHPTSTTR